MSKLSFRARALDAAKALPIYHSSEIPDSADVSLINRAVPQMPTGMEKEEEAEHHLQQAIVSGTVIPTPEVYLIDNTVYYSKFYPETYKLPRQLIYMQPFSMETDIPDYDMDSEDETWVTSQSGKLELTPEKFEEMMDRLEKGSGQTVVTLQEAKALIKEDDDLIIAVYDYWLNKRLKIQQPLIPHVRTEARHGIANHNPYIAFRRRTEKMQTRKNRKNDESSYEKMLKLKRDLTRAVNLLEMVKKREKSKRELLHLKIEVFEKQTQAGDYSGQIESEALQQRPARPAFTPLFQPNSLNWMKDDPLLASLSRKERRHYKKRRHKSSSKSRATASGSAALNYFNAQGLTLDEGASSEDDLLPASPSDGEEEDEGVYAFRRKKDCEYLAPLDTGDNKPWYTPEEIERQLKFYPTSISNLRNGGYRMVGPCRRRVGRGGRVVLDRMTMQDLSELVHAMGYDSYKSKSSPNSSPPRTSSSNISPTRHPHPHPVLEPSSFPPGTPLNPGVNPLVEIKQEPPDMPLTLTFPASAFDHEDIRMGDDDFTSSALGCWHHFRPRTPDPLDTGEWLMISDSEETSEPVEPVSSEDGQLESSLQQPSSSSTPFLLPSYHLGLVVSSGDRPLTYPLETLISDPPLSLPSHVETPSSHVVLDQQNSELENTYYLMELNNEFLNVDVEADPWFSSMNVDMDAGQETNPLPAVDGDEHEVASSGSPTSSGSHPPPSGPPNHPPPPGPPPPPPSSTNPGQGGSNGSNGHGSGGSGGSSSGLTQQSPPNPPPDSSSQKSGGGGNNSSTSTPPLPSSNSTQQQQQQPDSSPETTVVNVKSGEETDGGKNEAESSKSSRELNRFALLISV